MWSRAGDRTTRHKREWEIGVWIFDRIDQLHRRCAILREFLSRRTQVLRRESSEDVAPVVSEGEPPCRLHSIGTSLSSIPRQVPETICVDFNTPLFHSLEKEGVKELRHAGFVLVAGGLGERLGYNGIKVSLPTEILSELSYLGFYIKKILAIQVAFAVDPHAASSVGRTSHSLCDHDVGHEPRSVSPYHLSHAEQFATCANTSTSVCLRSKCS